MNLIVAAHPDDEVIGLGAQLPRLRNAAFIHVTDGAPEDMIDAKAHGFHTRESYAQARHKELLEALSVGGIPDERCWYLGFVDQQATNHLVEITEVLADVLRGIQPRFVMTHAYEGGHPDHDAAAFVCHAARRLLLREGIFPGELIEFTSYHSWNGTRVAGEFLPDDRCEVLTYRLSAPQQDFKRRLFSCFVSQQNVLAGFPIDVERFRIAPEYDFSQPPHQGTLHYENFSWGVTGHEWRQYAREALASL